MSLKEIAKRSGTSVATVSRVLNLPDYHCKNKALEDRIWANAKELHYVPNAAARSLKTGAFDPASESPAIDVFFSRDFNLDHDLFFQELFEALRQELLARGSHINQMYSLPDITAQVNILTPTQKKATSGDGLILLGKCPSELVSFFKKRYSAIIGIDRNPTEFLYDEIFCNGTTAASMAMEHLISLGHTKIGYIGSCSYEARYIGYYQTLLAHKLPFNYGHIFPAEQTMNGGQLAMRNILDQAASDQDRPTAFFCANDCIALGVLKALKEKRPRGYHPAVISIDNITEAHNCTPTLTTINIPTREMAHHAVAVLYDRLEGHHTQNIRIELPCHLVVRESCQGC